MDELASIRRTSTAEESNAPTLPPMDRGREAYRFLAGALVLEMLTWGYTLSFAVFQDYFSNAAFKDSSPVAIATIGTVAVALQYGLLLPLTFVYRRFPHSIRMISWISLAASGLALLASSFATEVYQLTILQGAVYGAASSAMYAPVIVYLAEWFDKRKGMASGVIFAGTGLSGGALSLILGQMLVKLDWRWTIRIYAVVSTVLCATALTQVQPRLPIASTSRIAPLPIAWVRSRLFWPVLATVFLQAMSSLTVSLYIPTYSTALGQTFFVGQLALAFFNLAGVVGRIGQFRGRRV